MFCVATTLKIFISFLGLLRVLHFVVVVVHGYLEFQVIGLSWWNCLKLRPQSFDTNHLVPSFGWNFSFDCHSRKYYPKIKQTWHYSVPLFYQPILYNLFSVKIVLHISEIRWKSANVLTYVYRKNNNKSKVIHFLMDC